MDDSQILQAPERAMSPAMARLFVELLAKLRAVHKEADDAHADNLALREQRGVLLQMHHDAGREIKRLRERNAALYDENRRLLAERRDRTRVAA